MLFDKPDPMNPSLPIQSSNTGTRTRMASFIAILFLTAVLASGCVIHDPNRGGYNTYGGPVAVQPRVAVAVPAPVTFTFTDNHRHRVRDYYHHHPHRYDKRHKWKNKWKRKGRKHLPPGLRRRDVLPPGIQMQVIPSDLGRQLPPPPRGTRYGYYEDRVLLFDVQTRVVLDFIDITVSTGY